MAKKRKRRTRKTAIRTATSRSLVCSRCQGPIRKGWAYRHVRANRVEHYNATHSPACHDPETCPACLKPGRQLHT